VKRRPVLGGLAGAAALAACGPAALAACGPAESPGAPTASPGASTASAAPPAGSPTASAGAQILVFSKTAGFRHESIPAGIQALRDLFRVEATEDAGAFTEDNLARFRAVVFLNTSGTVLDAGQKAAFEVYIRGGGGFAGIHSAADTEYDWPFYGDLLGAHFASHPAVQPAVIRVEDSGHPATAGLGKALTRTDEWYNFRTNPRSKVHVLLTLDESSYTGGTMGTDHPHAWYRTYGRGRSFYTAGGHTVEAYAEPAFRAHLAGGIRYAAGLS
jgi:type 1 glutamine amidotransferase